MLSYVFMKILEGRPRSYDQRMDKVSGGRVRAMKQAVAAEVPPGSHVLDIGCGTGELGAMLCASGAVVDGFDLSPSMVAAARERIETEHLQDKLRVREMGVESMDGLPVSAFGAVASTLVLSELTDDERRFALRQAFRVLEPGGLLVVADEVLPHSKWQRIIHALARAPMLAATYLISGKTTRPISNLCGDVFGAGFAVEKEERSHGGALALLVARRPAKQVSVGKEGTVRSVERLLVARRPAKEVST